jgi:hypothetical protein
MLAANDLLFDAAVSGFERNDRFPPEARIRGKVAVGCQMGGSAAVGVKGEG